MTSRCLDRREVGHLANAQHTVGPASEDSGLFLTCGRPAIQHILPIRYGINLI